MRLQHRAMTIEGRGERVERGAVERHRRERIDERRVRDTGRLHRLQRDAEVVERTSVERQQLQYCDEEQRAGHIEPASASHGRCDSF